MQEKTVKIHKWTPVRRYSEAALKAAVAVHGPVAAAVYANLNFMSYGLVPLFISDRSFRFTW